MKNEPIQASITLAQIIQTLLPRRVIHLTLVFSTFSIVFKSQITIESDTFCGKIFLNA